ncbi:MAG: hypothetical protein AAF543_09745 [Pseudomonadota bacterium]
MTYLRDHWHGRHALPRAFWINFLIPFLLIAMGEPWIRPAVTGGSTAEAMLASFYIVIAHGVILPWQVVGLWRSSRRHLEERGDLGLVTFAQGALLIALVTVAGATTTTVQRIVGFGVDPGEQEKPQAPRYALTVLSDDSHLPEKGAAIVIDGPFDTGLSRDLKALLAKTPGIEAVILNSDGGRVFEARGVAKQIVENGLNTYVFDHCRSACTVAFVAGARRTLGEHGRLGFHGYRLEGAIPLTDPLEEQAKDRSFFLQQGLEATFVTQAFATSHEAMWHPDIEQLLRAEVVHTILGDR